TLAEYYQAAGETQKMLDLQAKIISLRPDDADLRFRYAQELYRRGKLNEACDEYVAVIKKQPRLLGNRYWEVVQAFQRAKKEADLARALGEIDLKALGQPYMVTNLLSNLMQTDSGRVAGMVLFKKAWEAFPSQRGELMSNLYDSATWKLPEVLEYGRQSLLPSSEAVRQSRWYGITGLMSFDQDGRISAVMHRVLDGVAGGGQLGKLRDDIAAAIEKNPQ